MQKRPELECPKDIPLPSFQRSSRGIFTGPELGVFQNPFVLGVHSKEYNAAECRPGPGWCLAFGDFKMDRPHQKFSGCGHTRRSHAAGVQSLLGLRGK